MTWLSVLTALPVVVAAVRAISAPWTPEGDDAIIAARIHSVFSSHPPLQGMRSTSGFFDATVSSHHPGPLEFYLYAPIAALTDFSNAGIVLAVAVINIACVVGVVVMAHRMRGLRTSIPVSGAVLLAEWMLGPDVLARPFNPYAGILAILLMIVAAWATVDHDSHGLWLTGLSGSFAAQCNLAFGPLVIGVVGTTCLTVGYRAWQRSRTWQPRGTPQPGRRTWFHHGLTTGALLLAWLPSLLELFVVHPNNLTLLARYATGSDAPVPNSPHAVGIADGARFVVGHLSPTSIGTSGTQLSDGAHWSTVAAGGVVVILLICAGFDGRRRVGTAAGRGCWVLLVAILAESLAVSRAPVNIASTYWLLPVLVITPLAYAVLIVRALEIIRSSEQRRKRLTGRWHRPDLSLVLGSVVAATIAVLVCATSASPSRVNSDRAHAVNTAVLDYLQENGLPHAPVQINPAGAKSYLSIAPALGFALLRNHHQSYFLGNWPYPEDRSFQSMYVTHAPADPIVVTVADADSVAAAHPSADAQSVQPVDGESDIRIWIAIPPGRHL